MSSINCLSPRNCEEHVVYDGPHKRVPFSLNFKINERGSAQIIFLSVDIHDNNDCGCIV